MTPTELLLDAYDRIHEVVHEVADGLDPVLLTDRLDGETNSIGWLLWHLTRVQDDHVAGVAGTEQVWSSDGWAERFALPYETTEIGYGQGSDDVGAFRVSSVDLLTGYHDAVHERTAAYLRGLDADELDRVVDASFDPPVTLSVRLVSIVSDDLQHAGQATFLRGVLERQGR